VRRAAVIGQDFGHADGRSFNVTEAARPAARGGGRAPCGFSSGAMRGAVGFYGFLFLSLSVPFRLLRASSRAARARTRLPRAQTNSAGESAGIFVARFLSIGAAEMPAATTLRGLYCTGRSKVRLGEKARGLAGTLAEGLRRAGQCERRRFKMTVKFPSERRQRARALFLNSDSRRVYIVRVAASRANRTASGSERVYVTTCGPVSEIAIRSLTLAVLL
jgi:hypothetical protein